MRSVNMRKRERLESSINCGFQKLTCDSHSHLCSSLLHILIFMTVLFFEFENSKVNIRL